MLEERALGLVDKIIVFRSSLRFYPIVIRQVTIACGFFLLVAKRVNEDEKTYNTIDVDNTHNKVLYETSLRSTRPPSCSLPICMGTKKARLSVNLFSLENRTRELNWQNSIGTLAPCCIMVPDITWT